MSGAKAPKTLIAELREQRDWPAVPMVDDVQEVLSYVAKPGRRPAAKQQVIRELFPNAYGGGIHIADALTGYHEF